MSLLGLIFLIVAGAVVLIAVAALIALVVFLSRSRRCPRRNRGVL